MQITTGGATSQVDYADGTCNKTYAINANGEATGYTFGKENS